METLRREKEALAARLAAAETRWNELRAVLLNLRHFVDAAAPDEGAASTGTNTNGRFLSSTHSSVVLFNGPCNCR